MDGYSSSGGINRVGNAERVMLCVRDCMLLAGGDYTVEIIWISRKEKANKADVL